MNNKELRLAGLCGKVMGGCCLLVFSDSGSSCADQASDKDYSTLSLVVMDNNEVMQVFLPKVNTYI